MHVFVHKADLSQLKKLHLLQLDIKGDTKTMFRFMTSILSGITQNIRIVKFVCCLPFWQEQWDHDDLIKDLHTLEHALLQIEPGKPHVIFDVYPSMAKNRSLLAYEHFTRRFPHLHRCGRLDVRFKSPDLDTSDGMYDLLW